MVGVPLIYKIHTLSAWAILALWPFSRLGTRLTLLDWSWAGIALLVIALAFWLVLLRPVLTHWVTPAVGVSLVLTVSTQSLAVLSVALARASARTGCCTRRLRACTVPARPRLLRVRDLPL